MATTGVSNFSVTRDDVIKAALRGLTELGAGETPTAEDYTNCSQAINMMLKDWQKKGAALWLYQELSLPLVAGTQTYSIGPGVSAPGLSTTRPMRVLDAFLRDSSGNDVPLLPYSRTEFDTLGIKTSQGIPNQYYVNMQLDAIQVSFYNTPIDSTHTAHLVVQRPIYDMNAAGDTFDLPQEWFRAIKWGLMDELALEYGVEEKNLMFILGKAEKYLTECFDFSVEEVSMYFTVNTQR